MNQETRCVRTEFGLLRGGTKLYLSFDSQGEFLDITKNENAEVLTWKLNGRLVVKVEVVVVAAGI